MHPNLVFRVTKKQNKVKMCRDVGPIEDDVVVGQLNITKFICVIYWFDDTSSKWDRELQLGFLNPRTLKFSIPYYIISHIISY